MKWGGGGGREVRGRRWCQLQGKKTAFIEFLPHVRRFTHTLTKSLPDLKGDTTLPKSPMKDLRPRTHRVTVYPAQTHPRQLGTRKLIKE